MVTTGSRHLVRIVQVGVGGLVVCYTILGAAVFQALETGEEREELPVARAEAARTQVLHKSLFL